MQFGSMITPHIHRASLKKGLALLPFFLMAFVHAQLVRIGGTIRERETGETIATAQIRVKGSTTGVLSDSSGRFSLQISPETAMIEVSHIGYKKQNFVLPLKSRNNLDIRLETINAMDPVVISAGPQAVLADKTIHLYDYDFYDDQLVAIVYDREKKCSKLALIDDNDSIIDTDLGPEDPGKLFKDCLGNVHAITHHWACQLYIADNELGYFQDSLALFERSVKGCLGNIDANFYFSYLRFKNAMLDYFIYNKDEGKWTNMIQIKDKIKIHDIMDPMGVPFASLRTEAEVLASIPSNWADLTPENHHDQFERLAFNYPLDAPLRIINGKVVVFDHLNGLIRSFEKDGTPIKEVAMSYHKEPKRERAIFVDEVRNEAYTVFERHGYFTLRRINLETGDLETPIDIPRQFPQKVIIRDRVLYFMYKEFVYDPVNRLFRMPI
jgi:hypothetical protein